MEERSLDGRAIRTPDEFYDAFISAVDGLMPDYGGRNLDALNDDLRELEEPLKVIWTHAGESRRSLGEWFGRCLAVLLEREMGAPVTVVLRPGS